MSGDHNMYTFYQPKNAGCWVINESLHIYVKTKPNWLNKKMVKLIFGWVWQDGDYHEQKKASEK